MPAYPKPTRRLTPLQIVLVAVLVLSGVVYEFANQPPASLDRQAASTLAALPAATDKAQMGTQQPSPTHIAVLTRPAALPAAPSGDFDYFVLALSWSPDYCAANASSDPQQCGLGKKLGFVLHGLWPQYTQGYPSECSTAPLPAQVKSDFAGLYPNDNLFEHEWSKHGTCSGLDARAYLELTQQLKQSVLIPSAYQSPSQPFRDNPTRIKQAFEKSNPGFSTASFELNCSGSGRYLKELYVCFAKDGQPAACGADVHKDALKSCASPDFLVRSSR